MNIKIAESEKEESRKTSVEVKKKAQTQKQMAKRKSSLLNKHKYNKNEVLCWSDDMADLEELILFICDVILKSILMIMKKINICKMFITEYLKDIYRCKCNKQVVDEMIDMLNKNIDKLDEDVVEMEFMFNDKVMKPKFSDLEIKQICLNALSTDEEFTAKLYLNVLYTLDHIETVNKVIKKVRQKHFTIYVKK